MKIGMFRLVAPLSWICMFSALCLISCSEHSKEISEEKPSSNKKGTEIPIGISVKYQTHWLHQAQFAGFYIAKEKRFYSNAGLDVQIAMGGPKKTSSEALNHGNADIVSMFLTTALREIDHGKQIVNIAQTSQKSSLLLVAKQSSGIRKIEDINGRRVGLWPNDFREPSIAFLKKHKINAEIVPVSWTTNVLSHGVVDVMNMMYYNEYDIFINHGNEPEQLIVFPLADYGVNIPEDGIYCNLKYFSDNSEVCRDFAEATLDGWIYAFNHQNEAISIVINYLKKEHLPVNIPHQKWMLEKMHDAVMHNSKEFGELSEEDYLSAVGMLIENGIIMKHLPYKEFTAHEISE